MYGNVKHVSNGIKNVLGYCLTATAAIGLPIIENSAFGQNTGQNISQNISQNIGISGMSFRVREEVTSDMMEIDSYRTTVGASLNPTNYLRSTPAFGQFGEIFRLYDDVTDNKGVVTHDTKMGLKVPAFQTGKAMHQVFLQGAAGDTKEGTGVETLTTLGNVGLDLILEQNSIARHTRKGLDASVDLGKIELSCGYDLSEKADISTEQPYARLIWKPNPENMLSLAGMQSSTGSKTVNTVGLSGIRFGSDTIGGRLYSEYSWDNLDNYATSGHLILAQKATVRRGAMATMNGRRLSENGAWGNAISPIGTVVTDVEGAVPNNMFPLYDRSDRGFAGMVSWKVQKSGKNEQTTLGGGIGYTLPWNVIGMNVCLANNVNFCHSSLTGKSLTYMPALRLSHYGNKTGVELYLGGAIDTGKTPNKLSVGAQVSF